MHIDDLELQRLLQPRMEIFPDDVLYSILTCLPLKSVFRFTCVCKSWLSIIRGPTFHKLHTLHFTKSESEPAILILTYDVIGEEKVIRISYMKQEGLELTAGQTAIANIVSPYSWSLVGTCDGLLCFAASAPKGIIMVCNPVTKEHVILPKPSSCLKAHRKMIAFGVDPTTNKYKVVCILYRHDICIPSEVYTIGDPGSWRKVQGCNHVPSGRPVYAKGTIYWLVGTGNHHDHQQERILSFDLGKEEFRMIQHRRIGAESSLVELGKRLAVVDSSGTTLVEVSVMDDSIPSYWKKEYILPVKNPCLLDWQSPQLICAREHNGVLLIWLQHCLMTYKRKGFARRDLKLKRFPTGLDWEICSYFRGSLVSMKHFNTGTENHESDVRYASDGEVYSVLARNLVFGKQDAARRCDIIVDCFKENGMLLY